MLPDLEKVPYAMQPECLCGVDVVEVQRRTAEALADGQPDGQGMLQRLLSLPFDAILTTNYTYEIERTLTGRPWTEAARRKAFTVLDGSTHAVMLGITYHRGTQRSYIFALHPEKEEFYRVLLKDFLETAWKDCFTSEPISQA